MNTRKEFGDFQTPAGLAARTVALAINLFGNPDVVIEPTAGLGAFLKASVDCWGGKTRCEGYEINRDYVECAKSRLAGFDVKVFHRDFFAEDWKENLTRHGKGRVLVLGNLPWVTNADLSQAGSRNVPPKSNFQGLQGMDARMGKSNFDISEWMLIRLIEALPPEGAIAMLCKTITARKVLRHFWKTGAGRENSALFRIDAKAEFGVSVDACLFVTTGRHTNDKTAKIYSDLEIESESTLFGLIGDDLVSDVEAYQSNKDLDGGTPAYTWRSGVKHDAAKVMELTRNGDGLINGFGESVEIEDDYVFPLFKSSDLGNGRTAIRKFVLITQTHTGDDTAVIRSTAPNTWAYLERHADTLDSRASAIYRNRPRFSVFGVGAYSFSPWKIAISGLYKKFSFVVVPPHNNRPVMIDDTCYSIPCKSEAEARFLHEILSSEAALAFLQSLVFTDSKRPITIAVLRRISLMNLAHRLGRLDGLRRLIRMAPDPAPPMFRQLDVPV